MRPQFDKGLGTERIVAFSDGVFAIAITLLVLNLRIPDLPHDATSAQLIAELRADLPNMQAYVVSFLVVGLFWVTHHRTFGYIRRYDSVLVWLNLILLLFVCIVPYPTAMLGRFSGQVPTMIYATNLGIVSLLQSAIWLYATTNHRLVDPDLPPTLIHFGVLRGLSTFGIFLLSFVVAHFDAEIAMFCWVLIPVVLVLLARTYHKQVATEEPQTFQHYG